MNKGTIKPEPQIKQTYQINLQDIGDVYNNYEHLNTKIWPGVIQPCNKQTNK